MYLLLEAQDIFSLPLEHLSQAQVGSCSVGSSIIIIINTNKNVHAGRGQAEDAARNNKWHRYQQQQLGVRR
jgi:hypothetical protein